jgi:hypothetical protein
VYAHFSAKKCFCTMAVSKPDFDELVVKEKYCR